MVNSITCPVCKTTFDERIVINPAVTPPVNPPPDPPPDPPSPIPQPSYTKLNKIAPLSGDFYGLGLDSCVKDQVKLYTLPVGEVYPGKKIRTLSVTTIASVDGRGCVWIKLTSPEGIWSDVSQGGFADQAVEARARSWPQGPNYPAEYLPTGNWTLEITGKADLSNFKIWWKCN
jgi:hypothetical protein